MRKIITLLLLIAVLFTSCSGDFKQKMPYEYSDDGTWEGIFLGFWHGMNENYVFWDVDKTDWDNVYRTYLPLFKDLGKYENDEEKNEKAARYFFDIVKGLSDGHLSVTLNLEDDIQGIKAFNISPGVIRLAKRNGTSDDQIFEKNYIDGSLINVIKYLPPEVMRENAYKILAYDFGFSFYDDSNNLKTVIKNHSDFINAEGKTILLYSSRYPIGTTVTRSWGNVTYYNTAEVIGSSGKVNNCFSSWTLMIVLKNTLKDATNPDGTHIYNTDIESIHFAGLSKANGNIPSDIVYTCFSDFFITGYVEDEKTKPGAYEYLSSFHDIKANPNAKGMIVDIRSNGGGYNLDREYLFGDIMKEKQLFGYQKTKTGDNRLDFSGLLPVYVYPEAENMSSVYNNTDATHLYNKPFAVLANCYSVSNAEMTVFLAKSMPKGCHIGSTTFGGQGTLGSTFLELNAGQFTVGKYISQVYTPFAQIVDINGVSHEGEGCVPDIEVEFNQSNFENGIDNRLDKAFSWVDENSIK